MPELITTFHGQARSESNASRIANSTRTLTPASGYGALKAVLTSTSPVRRQTGTLASRSARPWPMLAFAGSGRVTSRPPAHDATTSGVACRAFPDCCLACEWERSAHDLPLHAVLALGLLAAFTIVISIWAGHVTGGERLRP